MITTKTYNEYLSSNKESPVSLDTFMAIKPLYIRSMTVNDIEICCCKNQLHVQCCKKRFLEWLVTFLSEHSKNNQDQTVGGPS